MTVGILIREKGSQIRGPQEHEEADPNLHTVILSKDTELRDDQNEFVECLNKALPPKAEGNKERKISGHPDVHILAHSMGNRGLIMALKKMSSTPSTLKNVVFAAADVERKDFDEMVRKVKMGDSRIDDAQQNGREKLSARAPLLTVYSSMTDQALWASKYVNWSKGRLGDTSFLHMETQEKGSDQVDVTGSKVTKAWLHHSYHVESPAVLDDIEVLGNHELNVEERYQQGKGKRIKLVTAHGKKFFAFDTNVWQEEQRCS
uniref:Uncharacterized protein n=1 Tax=Physcomitrium patens TaxID=3218 RepID=A0A2K1J1R7_PHYPA|nr:hypothetical protein PHYPA_023371 [Physcomitrium patens]